MAALIYVTLSYVVSDAQDSLDNFASTNRSPVFCSSLLWLFKKAGLGGEQNTFKINYSVLL